MTNQFPSIFSDETYAIHIENDERYIQIKQDFTKRAKSLSKWHTARIVSIILLGYSYILYLANTWYPDLANLIVAQWLVDYL